MKKGSDAKAASRLDLDGIDLVKVLADFDEGVIIADRRGRIIFYNRTMGKIDGLDPQEVLGKKVTDIYELNTETSIIFRCLNSGEPIINDPLIYRTRFGKTAYTLDSALPLFQQGELVGAICFVKDYNLLQSAFDAAAQALPASVDRYDNGTRFTFGDIVGKDPEFLRAIKIARMAAKSSSSVMLMGRTGTGKELFAQAIHNQSPRKKYPYIAINCAAIPENLLEGILFGTAKGAFTGAMDKPGLFERANGGTLFLDEINSMPPGLQAKLLRVLQEKKVRRVGSLKETALNLKIISSVNRDPRRAIQEEALRIDLFYRLAVIYIRIPLLRERGGDRELLTRHFISTLNQALGKRVKGVSPDVMECFRAYDWPGNVRELQNTVEAAMNMVSDTDEIIERRHLPGYFQSEAVPITKIRIEESSFLPGTSEPPFFPSKPFPAESGKSLVETQSAREEELICQALRDCNGNVSRASRDLGISRQLLHYKMKKYGLDRNSFCK
ncbi:MAG: sigma 54-interacting transcriptional regulator [Deltaproteobacteria bacterium]|nr:sigma 54-interacting transcriptional regulator [Deltaproteobacteria bacterium]